MIKNIIIIPYRDRTEHLKYWIQNSYPKLNDKLDNLEVIIVEQSEDNKLFNRGKLLNIGYHYFNNEEYNYFTHDIDHNPINTNIYNNEINDSILSLKSGHIYSLGGIIKFKGSVFRKINGFRNDYWGWGIEDRDLFYRAKYYNINIIRNYDTKYKVLNHKHMLNQINRKKSYICNKIFNSKNKKNIEKFILDSGLNNLEYKILKTTPFILNDNVIDNIKTITVKI